MHLRRDEYDALCRQAQRRNDRRRVYLDAQPERGAVILALAVRGEWTAAVFDVRTRLICSFLPAHVLDDYEFRRAG